VFLLNKKIHILLSQAYCVRQVVKTPTIISNNPVYIEVIRQSQTNLFSECTILYDMFRGTWRAPGEAQYIHNTLNWKYKVLYNEIIYHFYVSCNEVKCYVTGINSAAVLLQLSGVVCWAV
jgi:hypothetical protein